MIFVGMRGNYVDVMNPGTKKPQSSVPPPDMFPQVSQTTSAVTNFFVPAPSKCIINNNNIIINNN